IVSTRFSPTPSAPVRSCWRKDAGIARCMAANCASMVCGAGAAAGTAAPHSGQNRAEGLNSAPQDAHLPRSGVPHAEQNFASAPLSTPPAWQRIFTSPSPSPEPAGAPTVHRCPAGLLAGVGVWLGSAAAALAAPATDSPDAPTGQV